MKKHRGEYPMPVVPIPGWMSGLELEWLYQQAKLHKTIVEIGSAYGRSSHALLTGNYESFQNEGRVYCVDYWPLHKKGTRTEFDTTRKDTIRRSTFFQTVGNFPNLNVLEMPSGLAQAAIYSGNVGADMVFLDGGTDNIVADIHLWSFLAKSLFCGHDYSEEYPNVIEVVDSCFPNKKIVPETTIWYVER
jgi:predicted O-methyltransferase YrrM